MIRHRMIFCAVAGLFVAAFSLALPASPAFADDAGPSMNRADWASDLDVLYTAMKADHPALHHRTDAKTMDAYVAAFRKTIPRANWPQYVMGLYKLLALVGDGHTAFYPMPDAGPGFDTRYPILPTVFADGVYITAADAAYREAVGGKIVAVGGHPIGDVFRTTVGYWDHENETWVLRWFPLVLRRPGYLSGMGVVPADVSAPVTWTIQKDGVTRDFDVKPVAASVDAAGLAPGWVHARDEEKVPRPTPLHGTDAPFDFFYLKEAKAVYAVYRQVGDSDKETVAAFAARLFKFVDENPVDKLIVDIRENGGGDNYLNQPLLLGMIKARGIDRPGHLFVLTGRQTFSAAQNFANQSERWTQALFVGAPTGSSPNLYGDAKQMTLPKTKLHPMVATLYWEDSDPNDKRVWIMPDIAASDTFADYLAGRDPALQAALGYKADEAEPRAMPNTHWLRKSQAAAWPSPFDVR